MPLMATWATVTPPSRCSSAWPRGRWLRCCASRPAARGASRTTSPRWRRSTPGSTPWRRPADGPRTAAPRKRIDQRLAGAVGDAARRRGRPLAPAGAEPPGFRLFVAALNRARHRVRCAPSCPARELTPRATAGAVGGDGPPRRRRRVRDLRPYPPRGAAARQAIRCPGAARRAERRSIPAAGSLEPAFLGPAAAGQPLPGGILRACWRRPAPRSSGTCWILRISRVQRRPGGEAHRVAVDAFADRQLQLARGCCAGARSADSSPARRP